jgi:hypothetical protein
MLGEMILALESRMIGGGFSDLEVLRGGEGAGQ